MSNLFEEFKNNVSPYDTFDENFCGTQTDLRYLSKMMDQSGLFSASEVKLLSDASNLVEIAYEKMRKEALTL